jgi:hypothetical protein
MPQVFVYYIPEGGDIDFVEPIILNISQEELDRRDSFHQVLHEENGRVARREIAAYDEEFEAMMNDHFAMKDRARARHHAQTHEKKTNTHRMKRLDGHYSRELHYPGEKYFKYPNFKAFKLGLSNTDYKAMKKEAFIREDYEVFLDEEYEDAERCRKDAEIVRKYVENQLGILTRDRNIAAKKAEEYKKNGDLRVFDSLVKVGEYDQQISEAKKQIA